MRFMATENDIKGVIEPLAGYICASDQPKVALVLAVEVLLNEVEQMNKTARAYLATSST